MHTLWRLDYSIGIDGFSSLGHLFMFGTVDSFSAFLVQTFSTFLYIPIFHPFPNHSPLIYSSLLNRESRLILPMSCDGASGSGSYRYMMQDHQCCLWIDIDSSPGLQQLVHEDVV